jgi:SAM-dependent MidA family methyltransferase
MSDAPALLHDAITAEIGARGPIPFARYMELCLYHPSHGYYTRGIGGGGGRDYLTSSGTHRGFGLLVARQVEEMWRRTGRPDPFHFVEFGPGEGIFAADFLGEAGRSPSFAQALHYVLVETSPVLTTRQKSRLGGRSPIRTSWAADSDLERPDGLTGCLFANEVLDAFPVHRVVGTSAGPREIHVTLAGDGATLEETLLSLSSPALERFIQDAGLRLEDGQEVDLNLAAPCWIAWAVRLLGRGYVILVDYGMEAADLYRPERRRGTLLAYHRHRTNEEFLARPGDQDLTAHIDLTATRRAAEAAGARCLGTVSQSRFLLALGAVDLLQQAAVPPPGTTNAASPIVVEAVREREALKELILPGRMGDRFRVMVLGVGDVSHELSGLQTPWRRGGPMVAGSLGPGRRPADGVAGEER